MAQRHHQYTGFVVERGHLQAVGCKRQPGDHGVHAAVQQGLAPFVHGQVQGRDYGIGVLVAQFAYGRGDDDVWRVADGDAAGPGRGPRARRSLVGSAQQRGGEREEDLARLREVVAVRRALAVNPNTIHASAYNKARSILAGAGSQTAAKWFASHMFDNWQSWAPATSR
ncbi:hypothetical protein GCM10009753_76080 [Streptantibioticus ferralitis]